MHGTQDPPRSVQAVFVFPVADTRYTGEPDWQGVAGTRYFITTNPELRKLWKGEIEGVAEPDEKNGSFYRSVFTSAGYRVIR